MCPDCQCSRLDAKTDDTPAKIKDKIKCQQEYVDYCRRYGVYVPVKDAAWEEDDTYFEDQKAEYGQCDQDPCLCPDGNKYDDWDPVTKDKSGKWYIVLCSVCAGSGSHRQCGAIAVTDDWICNTCKAVVRKQKEENDEPQAEEAEEQGNGVKDIDDGNIDKEHDEDDEVVVNLDHEDVEGEASQQAGESSEAVPDVPHGSETTESMLDLEAEEGEKRKLDSGGDDHEDEPSRKKAKNMDNNHLN